jgi:hypoxanthine phosphoribosyltransferase
LRLNQSRKLCKRTIITLNESDLEKAMLSLWEKIEERGETPDGIVGIATGGLLCAEKLRSHVALPIFSCALRRPTTEMKQRPFVRRVLAGLPYAITDWLRVFEDAVLERRALAEGYVPREATEQLHEDVAAIVGEVSAHGLHHLVVIDDAVDSGATLSCVMATLAASLPPGTRLTSAVVTRTRLTSQYYPDVALYEQTNCRFPWSLDFRGRE